MLRRRAVDDAEFGGARAAVDHLVVGHHHDFVGCGEAVDAERIEFAPGAAHHAVVDHDEVGIRIDDVAGLHLRASAVRARTFSTAVDASETALQAV